MSSVKKSKIPPKNSQKIAPLFQRSFLLRAIFLKGRKVCEEARKVAPSAMKEMDFLKKKTLNKGKIFFSLAPNNIH